MGKAQDLINVLQLVWVTAQGKIGERNQKGSYILDGQVWSSLEYGS